MIKTVFLDRDGTLCDLVNGIRGPRTLSELIIRTENIQACKKLKEGGFLLIGITNQPDIARGKLLWSDLCEINNTIQRLCGIQEFFVCPHDDYDNCNCRKPLPGLINLAVKKYNIDIQKSYFIGDTWRDRIASEKIGIPNRNIIIIGNEYTFDDAYTYILWKEGGNK